MAISNQIQRLTTLRNNIRTKLINLGILPAASTSATLSECYNVLSSVTGLGASSYTPTTVSQVIPSGRYLSGVQTINAIPSAYIIPSGTVVLSSSGTFDVGSYASADVTVTGGPSGMYIEFKNKYGNAVTTEIVADVYLHNTQSRLYANMFAYYSMYYYSYSYGYSYRKAVYITDDDLVTQIDFSVFKECKGLDYVPFNNLSSVQKDAFYSTYFCAPDGVSIGFSFPKISESFPRLFPYANIQWFRNSTISLISGAAFYSCSDLVDVELLNLKQIRNVDSSFPHGCFENCISLKNVSFPLLSEISDYGMFYNCKGLTVISLPLLKKIREEGRGTFYSCTNLERIYLPVLQSVSGWSVGAYRGTFAYCPLSEIECPELTTLSSCSHMFYDCSALSSVSFPKLTGIYSSPYLFMSCVNLSYLYFPLLSIITGPSTFKGTTMDQLERIDLPELTTIGNGGDTFASMYSLREVNLPKLSVISGATYCFFSCRNLKGINLPEYQYSIATNFMFARCSTMSFASFPKTSKLSGSYMFASCYNLISIFLLGSSVCALGNTIASMFGSTPISTYSTSAGRWGSVFVPASLLAQYKAATNWTTISSKIFAYEDYFS